MRAGLLHDKYKKGEERLICTKPQSVESHNACSAPGWREHHPNTEEVYYFMQIPHELPLITTLLPPRGLLFTAVNQSRSDNKQQKETGAVSGLSPPRFIS